MTMHPNADLPARVVIPRLLAFLAPYRGTLALAVLSGLAAVAAGVGLMGTSAYLISAAALRPPFGDLQVAVVAVRFFGLSRAGFRYLERLLSHSVNLGLLARLRVWFFRRIEPLVPGQTGDLTSGDLLARWIADIDTLENFFVRVVAPALTALLASAGMALFLGLYHPSLGLVILAGLWLGGLGIPLLAAQLSRQPGRQVVEARARLSQQMVETVQGAADLLALNQEDPWLSSIAAQDAVYRQAEERMAWIHGLQAGLSSLAASLTVLVLLGLSIRLVNAGAMPGTSLAVVVLAGLASFEAVSGLPQAAQHLETSLEAARRLIRVTGQEPAVADPPEPASPPPSSDLAFQRVSFSYPSAEGAPALEEIDLAVKAGGWIAAVGASGAGKTTLVNLLLRFWDPAEGSIRLGGVDLRCLRQADLRQRVGVIAQSPALFYGSVRQNLLLANPIASDADLEDAVRKARLEETILSLPQGYDTLIGERGFRLSAGQRQRLAVARALLQDPPLLVLDEPTSSLDPRTEAELLDTLFSTVFPGRGVLLITHRFRGLERMDEIAVLDGGRIVERGSHADLLARGGRYARLYACSRDSLL